MWPRRKKKRANKNKAKCRFRNTYVAQLRVEEAAAAAREMMPFQPEAKTAAAAVSMWARKHYGEWVFLSEEEAVAALIVKWLKMVRGAAAAAAILFFSLLTGAAARGDF